jgi:guanylate kinase
VVDLADYRLRLETALQELEELLSTDYYIPVINDDLKTTVTEILALVDSHDKSSSDEPQARDVAKRLAENIKSYLEETA